MAYTYPFRRLICLRWSSFRKKSLDGQRKSSYSTRKENIVWRSQAFSTRIISIGSTRTHTRVHVLTWMYIHLYIYICAHVYISTCIYTHTHTRPRRRRNDTRSRWQPTPSRISLEPSSITIYLPGSTSTYLVSWLPGSKIFPTLFHQDGRRWEI